MAKKNFEFLEIAREMPIKFIPQERIGNFNEIYGRYNADNAGSQSSRCIECGNPYCEWKCPVHNYIPNWLDLVEKGELFRACDLLHLTNSLPEVCGRICPQDRLCEGACTLNDGFGAVTIGAVEKYIADEALTRGWRPDLSRVQQTNHRVAIVGAGPAGMACSDVLARNGIRAVVYDRYPRTGGLLTYGIPSFKLEKQIVERRQRVLEGMGVEFRCGLDIGKDIPFQKLLDEYDAVFLGLGTYGARDGGLEGCDHPRVHRSLDYLIGNTTHINRWDEIKDKSYTNFADKRVLVLGGGDTAMDCVRTAVRQGARKVVCAYRRQESEMPGSATEVGNAKEEGVRFIWNRQPLSISEGGKGALTIKVVYTTKSDQGKLIQTEKVGKLRYDDVIIAFGFNPSPPPWMTEHNIKLDSKGLVDNQSNQLPYQSSNDNIFAGGDMSRGSDLVVTAVYDGRQAAKSICARLGVTPQADDESALG